MLRANVWAKNDNQMKETMAKSHIRQLNRNRAQIPDERWDQFICGETELSSQSENEVRESYGHTSLDMAGMNMKQIRPSKNNNTKQYGMTEATLAQYRNCGGDDQRGMIIVEWTQHITY